jgi:hypothetical protein
MKQNRVVVLVNDGIADCMTDANVESLVIDIDNLKSGEIITTDDIAGFEDLIPQWFIDEFVVLSAQALLDEMKKPELKSELLAYAYQQLEIDPSIDDEWYSFNDQIDINIFNGNATAYPVVAGQIDTTKSVKLIDNYVQLMTSMNITGVIQ